MKRIKAWAIVTSANKIDCFDYRLPVYWYKKQALAEMKKKSFSDSVVLKVEIRGPIK